MNPKTRGRLFSEGLLMWREQRGLISLILVIYTDEFNGQEVVVVHWYDEERKKQHAFHLCISPRQIEQQFAADVESFRVIFLGQVKDFPKESQFYYKIAEKFQGKNEKLIVFAAGSAGLGLDEGGFAIPVHFAVEVIIIGSEGRLIRPETYSNPDIWFWLRSQLNRSLVSDISFSAFLKRTGIGMLEY